MPRQSIRPQPRPAPARRILAARGLRSFAYGLLAIVLLALGLPFIVAGTLKTGQDLGLWLVFHRVRLPTEETLRPW